MKKILVIAAVLGVLVGHAFADDHGNQIIVNVPPLPVTVNVTAPAGPQGVQGIQGVPGLQGPQGPQGPAGASGLAVIIRSTTGQVTIDGGRVFSDCPTGYTVTGGGYAGPGSPNPVTENHPIAHVQPDGSVLAGWVTGFSLLNINQVGMIVTVYALCAPGTLNGQ
jgi:hypothetical protein